METLASEALVTSAHWLVAGEPSDTRDRFTPAKRATRLFGTGSRARATTGTLMRVSAWITSSLLINDRHRDAQVDGACFKRTFPRSHMKSLPAIGGACLQSARSRHGLLTEDG